MTNQGFQGESHRASFLSLYSMFFSSLDALLRPLRWFLAYKEFRKLVVIRSGE
jgi:hypothetical protein